MAITSSIKHIVRVVLKKLLPLKARTFLRGIQRDLLRIRLSIRNAKKAFRPYETSYRLNIGSFGGFLVAYREGTADEAVINHSFDNDIYFRTLRYEPQEDHIIMDIG